MSAEIFVRWKNRFKDQTDVMSLTDWAKWTKSHPLASQNYFVIHQFEKGKEPESPVVPVVEKAAPSKPKKAGKKGPDNIIFDEPEKEVIQPEPIDTDEQI